MNNKILIVDDTPSIHEDFRKILMKSDTSTGVLDDIADSLFGKTAQDPEYRNINYQIESAFQGEEALQMIEKAEQEGDRYALVFMDVRMPPGLDGVKTIGKIWERYPYMEIVICTAYSDYSWIDIIDILGPSDHLLVLKKPFDADEAQQMALAMTRRAAKTQEQIEYIKSLEAELKTCRENIDKLESDLGAKDKG